MNIDDPRDRLIDGFNQERFNTEVRRGRWPGLFVLLAVAVAVSGGAYLTSKIAPTVINPSHEIKIAVDDATAVVPNVNRVRFKGVPIGSVVGVGVEGEQATITIRTRKKFGRFYRDARAELRPNTALNDMYLDIVDRGTPASGVIDENTPLAPERTATPVSVSEVLNTFTPSVRVRLRTLLDDLGHGLNDNGRALGAVLVKLTPFVRNAERLTEALAERAPLVRRLVANSGELTGELGARERQLRVLLEDGGATVRTLQAGSKDLDATLRELPPAVRGVRSSFAEVRGALGDVDRAVTALRPVARELPSALTDLRAVAVAARPAVDALQEPVRRLVPLARDLRPLSADLDRAVTTFLPQADTVDKVTRSLVMCKKGFQNFFQWNVSISKFGDARGPIPRGNVVFGAQSSSVIGDPNEIAPEACSGGRAIGGRPAREEDKR